jgi:hypothetical protein
MHVRPLALDLEPIPVNFDRFNKYRYGPFVCFFEHEPLIRLLVRFYMNQRFIPALDLFSLCSFRWPIQLYLSS